MVDIVKLEGEVFMQVIYARVSLDGQTTDNQTVLLRNKYPEAAIITETASGAKNRPKLSELLNRLTKGDQLIVAALDRLGRRTSEVLTMIEDLERRGIILISEREGVDYSTVCGRLITQVLVSVAEMERNIISERTKKALEARKAQGIKLGRTPVFSMQQVEKAKLMRAAGDKLKDIKAATGMSMARIYQLTK